MKINDWEREIAITVCRAMQAGIKAFPKCADLSAKESAQLMTDTTSPFVLHIIGIVQELLDSRSSS